MKTFLEAEIKELLDQYSEEKITFSRMVEIMNERANDKAKEYATQVAQDALNRAAENAEKVIGYREYDLVIEMSITETQIILP